jgi:dihydroxy-acid dehydratase
MIPLQRDDPTFVPFPRRRGMPSDPRRNSRILVDGPDRAAARSFFKAVGFTDEDLRTPLVGVGHCWSEMTPCNWNH